MQLTEKEKLALIGGTRAESIDEYWAWIKKHHTFNRIEAGLETYSHWAYFMRTNPSRFFETGIEKIKAAVPELDFTITSLVSETLFMVAAPKLLVKLSKTGEYYAAQFTGDKEYVTRLRDLNEWLNKPSISWYYLDHRGETLNNNITFNFDKPVYDSHYPYIQVGVDNYIDDFRKSDANLLLLIGDPGTGKSTFIKHYIRKFNTKAMLTHDEVLLGSDQFMIQFLSSENTNLLIIEDADLLLKSREFAGNKVMAKLLNVSDGVLKLTHGKKIILSTNISNLDDVDSALTRPGRCYDVLNFRNLTHDEANAVARDNDLDPCFQIRDYSLAEVFNRAEFMQPEKRRRRVGF